MATEINQLDYTFNFGKYKDLDEQVDKNNVLPKLNALLNIIHMRPGTLQDTPFCGINMDTLLYSEGDEMYTRRASLQTEIQQLSNQYIGMGFVSDVTMNVSKVEGSDDGSQSISMSIELTNQMGVLVESINTPDGLVFKRATLDSTPFTNT